MKINKDGITRTVIEFKNFVIKIPTIRYGWVLFLKGIISNITERNIYRNTTHKELLCPVTWCSFGGFILIMKRARILNDNEEEYIDYNLFEENGFGGDNKTDNYGFLNNKIVKVDYGD